VYLLFLLVLLHRYTHRTPHLRSYSPRTSGALVSVIVPARNEAANIATCVRSILDSAYEQIEVIVVDDRSSDGTADIVEQIARSPEARPRAPGAGEESCRRGGSANHGRCPGERMATGAMLPSPTPTRATTAS
jgi:cellulose synthase/poly-beta-1,6-N-acetylglucosamine synthase-like glycosyltransferase